MRTYNRIILASILFWPLITQAEFDLNFIPNNTSSAFSTCSTHGSTTCDGGTQTRFLSEGALELPETVVDPENGLTYYHLIVGDPAADFVQEVYIQTGLYGTYQGGSLSASGGTTGNPGNANDPLNISTTTSSGNGSANPNRIIMRQIVSDGEMTDEFLKDKYDKKPLITQSIDKPDITTSIVIDMSNSTYSDMDTPGTISYTMELQGADLPVDKAKFNMADDVQNSSVNAGRYTYTTGGGRGGSSGSYNYIDGSGFDLANTPWEVFFNPDTSGPWNYTDNRPN